MSARLIEFLIDTDWSIDFLGKRQDAIDLFSRLADRGIGLSLITYAELYEGVLGSRRSESLDELEELAASLDLISVDRDVARQFASLRRDLRTRGEVIPDHDLWIAATALRHDLALISRDHHFDRLPQLKRG